MNPLKLLLLSLFFLLIGGRQLQLNAQCMNGIISGHNKTEFCPTEEVVVNLIGEVEFFGDIGSPISPVFSISPTPDNGFTDNGNGTASFNPSQTGIGTFTITLDFDSGFDCKEPGTVTFTVLEVEDISIDIDGLACQGSDLELAVSETFENKDEQTWTGPNGFSSILTFPVIENPTSLNSGLYTVTVTYETGCVATGSRMITFNPAATVTVEANNPTCVGETLTVSATGNDGGNFNWTGPNNFSTSQNNINISNLTTNNAGTYNLVYTTQGGCIANESLVVGLSNLPEPNLQSSGPFCTGDAVLTLEDISNETYTYDWESQNTGTNYNDKVVSINNPTEANSGIYTVEVTNTAGCQVTKTISVEYNGSVPQLEIFGATEVCSGTSITLSEVGDQGQNHIWTGPNNFQANGASIQIDNSDAINSGVYTVKADNGNGCMGETSININVSPSPTIELIANETSPCEGTNLQLSESAGDLVNWNWTGPNNFSSQLPNPVIANISLNASGVYTLAGTNVQGCAVENTINITVNSSFNAGTGRNRELCAGPILNLNELLTGADGGGVFIDNNGALTNNQLATENLSPGLYLFTYTGPSNTVCNSTTRIAIRVREVPTPNIVHPTSFCLGAPSLTLTDSGTENYEYAWTHQSSGTNYTGKTVLLSNPTENEAGDYSVIITNSGGCEVSEAFSLIYNGAPPELSVTGISVVCEGGSINFSEISSEGQNHIWTGPNNFEVVGSTIDLNNLNSINAGLYTVQADNGNVCTAEASINLTVNPLPTILISSSESAVCEGSNVQLNENGRDLVTWNWTGPNDFNATTQNPSLPAIDLAAAGTYTLVGTDANGCSANSSLNLVVNQSFNAGTSRDLQVCSGSQVDLALLVENADPNGIFIDENGTGAVNGNIFETAGLVAGDYNFRYSLAESSVCISSTSFFVRVRAQLNAGEHANLSICQNEQIDLTTVLTSTADQDGNFIDIGNSGGLTISQFDGSSLAPATYQIIYRVGEGSVCPLDEATISVNLNPVPATPNLADTAICEGENISLSATNGSSYDWTNGATTQSIDIMPAVTTTYGVTVTNDFNCTSTGQATILVNPLPSLTVNDDASICAGDRLSLSASGAVTYTWTPSLGLNNNEIPNPIASPLNSTSYEVVGTSGENCSAKAMVNIEVNKRPTVSVSNDVALCFGESTTLSATGEGTIQWTPIVSLNNENSNTPLANPEITTDYMAILTDINGCMDTGNVEVLVKALPIIGLGEGQTICQGDTLELIASGGGTYQWESPDVLINPTSASQLVSPTQLTSYSVKVIGDNECEAVEEVIISVNDTPTADAGQDQTTCLGISATLTGSGEGNYEWSNGAADALIAVSPEVSTTYTLKVTNEFGCFDTDDVTVNLAPDFEVMVSPDTFYCLGGSSQLNAGGGVSYSWSPIIGLDNPEIANPKASPISTTSYEVIIQDEIGCIVKRTIDLEVKQVENFSLSDNQDVCEGSNVILEASGGVNYNWTPEHVFDNPTQASQTLMPNENATFQVEVEDEFGCRISDSVNVTIRPIPTVEASAANELCEGADLTLLGTGTGVSEWLWEGNEFTSTEQNTQLTEITLNQAGQFKLIGISEFGCESADSQVVMVSALPVAMIVAAKQVCQNAPLVLISNTDNPSNTQEWMGVGTSNFEGADWDLGPAQLAFSGNYKLTVTDEKGCKNQAEQFIEIIQMPNAGPDTVFSSCQGMLINIRDLLRQEDDMGLFELGVGLPDLENDVLNTQDIAEGSYFINYKVAVEGCPQDISQLTLNIDTPKTAGIDNSAEACQGTVLALNTLLQEADEGGVFQINTNPETLSGATWQTANLTPGTYLIDYVQENACGADQSQLAISVLEQVKAGLDIQTDLCKGSPFDLETLLKEATEGGQFQDLMGTNALVGSVLSTQDLPLGEYQFEYLVESQNSCPSDAAVIDISLKDILIAGLDNDTTFCTGSTIDLSTLIVNGDKGGDFTPIGITPPNFSETILETATSQSVNYEFEYKIGGTTGCPEDIATISLTLNESPDLQLLVPDTFLCLGDTIALEAIVSAGTGDLQVTWELPNGTSENTMISVMEAGNYQVMVMDEKACITVKETVITSNEALAIAIEGRVEICQNEDLTLQPTTTDALLNYTWVLPNGERINEEILIIEAKEISSGTYELQYQDQFNCQQSTDTMISLSPGEYFKSNFLTTNFACVGDSIQFIEIAEIELSEGATFEWDFGDGQKSTERDPVHVFQMPGLFPVSVKIDDQNCGSESIEKEINIVSCRKLAGSNRLFKSLNIYPNPTPLDTKLEIVLETESEMLMSIRDIHGRTIQEKNFQRGTIFREDLTIQQPGIYFIYLKSLGEHRVLKLVVEGIKEW